MSYLALARKWRPGKFSDVIGQDHVVSALTNALNIERVHHAFLFTGTRGVGKTTLARIFARALNCEVGITSDPCGQCMACKGIEQGNFIDLIEVDAASRTRVDDTRELLDNVQYAPTQGRCKIYLIDEVHMLSTHSFNALLKTLEEPPAHVKFLLATTDPQKLPTTILSRCIQFNLRSVEPANLSLQLEKILQAEAISFQSSALSILTRSANGSVRDALSLLDQAIAYSNSDVTEAKVRSMLGMIDDHMIINLFQKIIEANSSEALNVVEEMAARSVDYPSALDELLTLIHNLALFQVNPASLDWKNIDTSPLQLLSKQIDAEALQLLYQIALMGKKDMDYAPDPRSGFEMIVIRMISFQPEKMADSRSDRSNSVVPVKGNDGPPSAEPDSHAPDSHALDSHATDVGTCNGTRTETVSVFSPGSKAPVTIEDLSTDTGWQHFAESSGMSGISRQLLMNMVPKGVENKEITVSLSESSRHLFNHQRRKKIEQYCKEILSLDITIKVDIENLLQTHSSKETPSQRIERQKQEQISETRRAFTEDSNVQKLVETFEAKVMLDSITYHSPDS